MFPNHPAHAGTHCRRATQTAFFPGLVAVFLRGGFFLHARNVTFKQAARIPRFVNVDSNSMTDNTNARLSKRQQRVSRPKVTAHQLRSLLDYDPCNGVFLWSSDRGRNAKRGQQAGRLNSRGYREIEVCGRAYNAHRLVWLYMTGEWPTYEIDHLDGQRDNNAFVNLRDVPKNINKQNQRVARSDSSTGILGAHKTKNPNRWTSSISVGGKRFELGVFASPEAAGAAYVKAKRTLHQGCTI